MNLILINTDPMVLKLVEAIARRTGLLLIKYAKLSDIDPSAIPHNSFFVIDEGAITDKGKLQELLEGFTSCLLFSKKAQSGFTHTIKKPFLPSQILDVLKEDMERLGYNPFLTSDVMQDDLAPIASPQDDGLNDEFNKLEIPTQDDSLAHNDTEYRLESVTPTQNNDPKPQEEAQEIEDDMGEEKLFLENDDYIDDTLKDSHLSDNTESVESVEGAKPQVADLGDFSADEAPDLMDLTKDDVKSPDDKDAPLDQLSQDTISILNDELSGLSDEINDELGFGDIDFSDEPLKEMELEPNNTDPIDDTESNVLDKNEINEVKQLLEDATQDQNVPKQEPQETESQEEELKIDEAILGALNSNTQSQAHDPNFDDVPNEDSYAKELQEMQESRPNLSDEPNLDSIDIDTSSLQDSLESQSTKEALESITSQNIDNLENQNQEGSQNPKSSQELNTSETSDELDSSVPTSDDVIIGNDIIDDTINDKSDENLDEPEDKNISDEVASEAEAIFVPSTDSNENNENVIDESIAGAQDTHNDLDKPMSDVSNDKSNIDDFIALSEQEVSEALGENLESSQEPQSTPHPKQDLPQQARDEASLASAQDVHFAEIFANKSVDEIRTLLQGAKITININFADKININDQSSK